jgi:hypothetical protein
LSSKFEHGHAARSMDAAFRFSDKNKQGRL